MKIRYISKVFAAVSLLALIVLFSGCPYSSKVPIDEGTVKVSDHMVGKWISTADSGSQNPTYFILSKEDMYHATAKKMEFSSTDSTYSETVYHLTFSEVDGDVFLNAREEGNDSYNILKFEFDEKTGEAHTSEVTDYIKETFNSSAELKAFIAKNKSNSFFYTNTSETYVRK